MALKGRKGTLVLHYTSITSGDKIYLGGKLTSIGEERESVRSFCGGYIALALEGI